MLFPICRKKVSGDKPLPRSVRFETLYAPGTVEAVSYTAGREVSRAKLETAGQPAKIRLIPEKTEMQADGHDLIYVAVEITDAEGRIVPDAELPLTARLSGAGVLAGFGTGNPVTAENYMDERTVTWQGTAQAVLRAGYDPGTLTLTVSGENLPEETVELQIV